MHSELFCMYDQWSPNTHSYMKLLMIDMDQYGMDFTILSRDAQQSMDIVTNHAYWLVQQYQYIAVLALTIHILRYCTVNTGIVTMLYNILSTTTLIGSDALNPTALG
jgi:hypothetical protein